MDTKQNMVNMQTYGQVKKIKCVRPFCDLTIINSEEMKVTAAFTFYLRFLHNLALEKILQNENFCGRYF